MSAIVEEQENWYRKLRLLIRQYRILPENLWNCDEKGIIMGLAVGRQKAIVRSSARQKVAITDGNREFCSVLESVNAAGKVIPPFVVWANKVHCVGFYADGDDRPATFSRAPSGYMDDELGFDFISKHFDRYTTPTIDLTTEVTLPERAYRMLIVDGHSSHIAWPVVEYALDHRIILYCLPAHSTHLMQPLDVACFGPLARAYRSALQTFIYEHPSRSFGKQEFWDCLCTARKHALTKSNILSGFSVSGIWPLQPEKVTGVVMDRAVKLEPSCAALTTPLKVADIRTNLSRLSMTPHSRAIVQESFDYLENKVVKYRIIEPNSHGVKELRFGNQIKPRSQKHIKGPRTLDRAYIEQEKARIAAAEARDAEKAAHRDAMKLAKEIKAQQAIEAAKDPKSSKRGGPSTRGRGGARIGRFRLARRQKFDTEEADMQRLQRAMAFMSICGRFYCS